MKENDFPKLAAPAQRALTNADITSLKQLTKRTEEEISQLHGMGNNALAILRDALKAKGWSFRPAKAGEKFKKKGLFINRST